MSAIVSDTPMPTANGFLRANRSSLRGWITVFGAAMLLYWLTLAPDVVWQDQGDYQVQVARLNLDRPGDVVRVHPLFIATAHGLGRLLPVSYAYAANLTSAIFAAVTVANLYLLVFWLVGKVWPGVLAAGVFALAHSPWFLAVQAQTYSMANAALTGGLLLAIGFWFGAPIWHLWIMGFLFGLGLSAHMMSQVGFGVIMLWLLYSWRRGKLSFPNYLLIIAFWAIGAGLLWWVMWREYQRTGDVAATLASALWGRWGSEVFNIGRIPHLLKRSVQFFVLNFPTPLVLLAVPGLVLSFRKLPQRHLAWLLAVMTALYGLFAVRYDVPNQNNFFLPMYLLIAAYIGMGFAFAFERYTRVHKWVTFALLAAIPLTYVGISNLAREIDFSIGTRRHIPYRDDYIYYLRPWQHTQTGPRRFAEEVLAALPPNAVLLPDSTTLPPLLYVHTVEGRRQDVDVVDEEEGNKAASWPPERRLFAVSNAPGYYPLWVADEALLRPLAIGRGEYVYEILHLSANSVEN